MWRRTAGACVALAMSAAGAAFAAPAASAASAASAAPPTGGATPGVFTPGPGQEYELAFFIAAAVLTLLVAGGFIAVIVIHGRGSADSDREASPEDVEA